MYSKERKSEPFESVPEAIRYKQKVVTCDNEDKIVDFPVAEIRLYPMDKTGKLVEKEKVTNLLIKYYDKDGNIMQVVRME